MDLRNRRQLQLFGFTGYTGEKKRREGKFEVVELGGSANSGMTVYSQEYPGYCWLHGVRGGKVSRKDGWQGKMQRPLSCVVCCDEEEQLVSVFWECTSFFLAHASA